MTQSTAAGGDEFIKMYVKASVKRMITGTVVCLGIIALALFVLFPTCARTDTVTQVRLAGNKYYLTLKGDSGTVGMWSETKQEVGSAVCVRSTFAQ